ncbi:hypothetical protein DNAM_330 [Pseudomonas phage BroderSalsa]|nr:hypothetical protein DNAM_330 [Pseudomonas phage BroderSalsa]
MLLSLKPYAKTVPDNYSRVGMTTGDFGPPGYTMTPEAIEKAKRQESEYYDWKSYEGVSTPNVEHPEYRALGEAQALAIHWERIIQELEPLPRGV